MLHPSVPLKRLQLPAEGQRLGWKASLHLSGSLQVFELRRCTLRFSAVVLDGDCGSLLSGGQFTPEIAAGLKPGRRWLHVSCVAACVKEADIHSTKTASAADSEFICSVKRPLKSLKCLNLALRGFKLFNIPPQYSNETVGSILILSRSQPGKQKTHNSDAKKVSSDFVL